jgi:hypothetical protein
VITGYTVGLGDSDATCAVGALAMVARRKGCLRPTRLPFERDGDTPVAEREEDGGEVEALAEPEPEPEPEPELELEMTEDVAAAEAQTLRRMTRLSLAEAEVSDPSSPVLRADRLGLDSLPPRLPGLRINSSFETVFGREGRAQLERQSNPPGKQAVQEEAAQEVEAETAVRAPQAAAEIGGDAGLEAAAAELEAAAAALGCAAEPTGGALEEMDLDAIQADLDRSDSDKVDLEALAAELNAEKDSLVALAAQLDAAEAVDAAPQTQTTADCVVVDSAAPETPPMVVPTPGRPPVFELKNLVWIEHPALRTQTKKTRQGGKARSASRSAIKKKKQLRLAFKGY